MKQYRLGAISFINTKPLIYHFEQNPAPDVTWVMGVPSRLVDQLRAGDLDAALVSSVACLSDDRLTILPGCGIAARGAVDSIKLFCKKDPAQLRSVALDSNSRTAAALTRILLAECFDCRPEFITMAPDLPRMLEVADAALLIGDSALKEAFGRPGAHQGLHVFDGGQLWRDLTGLPFVFAVWAARRGVELGRVPELLLEAREAGRAHLDTIARAAAERLALSTDYCQRYLSDIIVYDLGPGEWDGLRCFRELAIRHGIVPPNAPPLRIGAE